MTYLHFAYAIIGRQFDSESGGGGGLALCGNEYSDLENAVNNLSSFVEKKNTFLQFGRGGGSANFSQNFRLALIATVKCSNNFSGSLHSQF